MDYLNRDAMDNMAEEDYGQLHAIHLNDNAVEAVLSQIPRGESNEFCDECGDEIPEQRRKAVEGCKFCIFCQEAMERNRKLKPVQTIMAR